MKPVGSSPLQAIILREKLDGKSTLLSDFTGNCEVRENHVADYLLVKCSGQKGDSVIENMGRFYK